VVAHPGGITLANELGDTIAVVEAKDAKGARITNSSGVRIDGRGYAVVPYLMPYSLNTIEIDPKGIPLDVEFKSTSEQIAPRANSVVFVRFPTSSGRAAVISARLPNGAALPFGATVSDASGATVGAIGQNSQVFVRGVADEGTLIAKWGDEADQICQISYRLPPRAQDKGAYAHSDAVCGDAGIASNGGAKRVSYARPVVSTGAAKPAPSTDGTVPVEATKPALTTGDASDALGDAIVSNVATVDQTQGAERLMLFMDAVPMKTYARTSVVSLADLALESSHH
jgi:outer membrane usher protein